MLVLLCGLVTLHDIPQDNLLHSACVATQNQFKTFNLVTTLDITTVKTWIISEQIQNIAKPAGKKL